MAAVTPENRTFDPAGLLPVLDRRFARRCEDDELRSVLKLLSHAGSARD